jgi:hypothetical protein
MGLNNMKTTSYLFSLFSAGLLLCGCAQQSTMPRFATCYGKNFNQLLESTNLKPLFNNIASELCSEQCGADGESANPVKAGNDSACRSLGSKNNVSVLVTDFVDIQSFAPATQGLLMGELMRGSLNSVCGSKITQVEFAKYFNLNEKGLVVLSRKVSEIKKDDYDQTEAIVGTYSYLNNKIVIFVRKINVVTGKISRMVTREVDYNCAGGSVSYTVK